MYIKRNSQGEISAVSHYPDGEIQESVADNSPELQAFLTAIKSPQQMLLEQSDQAMARVLEDVINVLVDKGTIRFTDLPDAAQIKLLSRRELRDKHNSIYLLDDGDDLKL